VKLTFLGTGGEIEARPQRHQMHSSLLISHGGTKVIMAAASIGSGNSSGFLRMLTPFVW
jgi:ribonuclease BN (tRNA processing enzyme)